MSDHMTPFASDETRRHNRLGITGFVLGIVGLVFGPLPVVGLLAWLLVVLGLIFAGVGYARARGGYATNPGISVAGLILSGVGLGMCVVWAVTGAIIGDILNRPLPPPTISYYASGDSQGATVAFIGVDASSTDAATTTTTSQPVTLPWRKDVQENSSNVFGGFAVMAGPNGGTVSCTLTIAGKVVKADTATGPQAIATCMTI